MKLGRPTLLTLFLIVFIDLIGFGIVMPLLPYWSDHLGAAGWQIGLAFGGYSFMQFLLAPWWGKLSDRVGRRPILLISLAGSTASYLLFAFAQSIEMILLSRLLAGACGANISVAHAYIADITTKENRSKGMGLLGAAFGLGFIFGPVLATAWAHVSYQAPAFFAASLCGANLLLAFFVLPESRPPEQRREEPSAPMGYWQNWGYVLTKPTVGLIIAVGFFFQISVTQWETTFALFLHRNPLFGYDLATFGWLLAYVGLLVAGLQGGIGKLVKKYGEIRLLRIGLGLFVLGLSGLAFCQNLPQLLVALTALSFGMGCTRPVMTGVVSIFSGTEEQGLVLGVFQGVSSLARIIGPLVGGLLIDHHLTLTILVAAGLGLAALGLTGRLAKA